MRDGLSNLEETTVHKTYSTVEDITETKVGGYRTVEELTTHQSYIPNGHIAGLNNETQDQPSEGEISTVKETKNENIKEDSVTETFAVSSAYRKELSKQMTTSLSTESKEESSTNVNQNVNTKDNDTLSILTQANETKEELHLTRPTEVTIIKSNTDNTTDRNLDDSSVLTQIHVSTIIGGSIGLVVLCTVICIVLKLKKKRALAEKAVYSYVNAVYQPPGVQNSENEHILQE